MPRPPQFFELVHLVNGPLNGAQVLIGRGHHILQVHTQTPYDDSKSDQPVEIHRYHYTRNSPTGNLFHYSDNLKTIPS